MEVLETFQRRGVEKKRKMPIQPLLFELRCHRGQPPGSRQSHSDEGFKDEVKKKAKALG